MTGGLRENERIKYKKKKKKKTVCDMWQWSLCKMQTTKDDNEHGDNKQALCMESRQENTLASVLSTCSEWYRLCLSNKNFDNVYRILHRVFISHVHIVCVFIYVIQLFCFQIIFNQIETSIFYKLVYRSCLSYVYIEYLYLISSSLRISNLSLDDVWLRNTICHVFINHF